MTYGVLRSSLLQLFVFFFVLMASSSVSRWIYVSCIGILVTFEALFL